MTHPTTLDLDAKIVIAQREIHGMRIDGQHETANALEELIRLARLAPNALSSPKSIGAEICPWTDGAGNTLRVGDTIRHPDGLTATVQFDNSKEDAGKWRAVYADGESLFLGNQTHGNGMAIKVAPQPKQAPADPLQMPTAAEYLDSIQRVESEAWHKGFDTGRMMAIAQSKHAPMFNGMTQAETNQSASSAGQRTVQGVRRLARARTRSASTQQAPAHIVSINRQESEQIMTQANERAVSTTGERFIVYSHSGKKASHVANIKPVPHPAFDADMYHALCGDWASAHAGDLASIDFSHPIRLQVVTCAQCAAIAAHGGAEK